MSSKIETLWAHTHIPQRSCPPSPSATLPNKYRSLTHRTQYPLIKEYTLNGIRVPNMITPPPPRGTGPPRNSGSSLDKSDMAPLLAVLAAPQATLPVLCIGTQGQVVSFKPSSSSLQHHPPAPQFWPCKRRNCSRNLRVEGSIVRQEPPICAAAQWPSWLPPPACIF